MPSFEPSNPKSSFVCIYQCRFCGCIIPFETGVQRHGKVCRFLDKTPKQIYQPTAMMKVNFPIPTVRIEKIIPSLKITKDFNPTIYRPRPSRRQSSLRALEKLRGENSNSHSDEESDSDKETDRLEDEDEESNFDFTESEPEESESDSDFEIPEEQIVPKRKNVHVRAINAEETTPGTLITSNGRYLCPYKGCGSSLHALKKLKEHFLLHLENSPFKCPIKGCNKNTRGKSFLIEHLEWHQGKNLVPCTKCGRFLHSKWMLEKLHKCGDMKKRKKDANGNFRPLRGKLKLKKALIRPEDFTVADHFIKSKQTATQIIASDPVFLQVCEENPGFREIILGRKDSNRKSIGEKYKCLKCDNSYSTRTLLQSHVTVRHTPRPFQCTICNKGFQKKGIRDLHEKRHKSHGNYVFVRKGDNGMWNCTKCGYQSYHECSVRRHWRLVHKVRATFSDGKYSKTEEVASAYSKPSPEVRTTSVRNVKDEVSESKPEDETKASFRVLKIKSEPPLELTMIKREHVKVDLGVKQEVVGTY